ncbi:DUF222 domain-containing protein [Paenarthrobacter sp. Z7-10]|uniref:HNH endonuclease signature motif containing protein n=1 Tax=Paenarthrobacter sp. Z7-10 TaxID=2787635 RepID=UPI0022A91B6A|nr:HNH endonuclease signature motif containing protein [Paenarthrobacter sp. Z7-10]MCZ2403637.1 DUF222 domain-containing protein [Paenarthrobacter sp. Z7-10]
MPFEGFPGVTDTAELTDAVAVLESFTASFTSAAPLMGKTQLLEATDLIERGSRLVQHLQVIAAHAVDTQNLFSTADTDSAFTWDTPTERKSLHRNVQSFLVDRLRISFFEANRRVHLGRDVLPTQSLSGQPIEARFPTLAQAAAGGEASTEALYLVATALNHVRPKATAAELDRMEQALVSQIPVVEPGVLKPLAAALELSIDQNGTEPSPAELTARQGIHYHGKYRGLHHLDIHADQSQYEALTTVMNTGTNPRSQTLEERALDPRTRPQKLLDALTGACQVALRTNELPRTGGHRPQVMVTIGYEELFGVLTTGQATGAFAFTGPVTAERVRRLACDADLIPLVLGSAGQILDQGRKQRLHTQSQRLAIIARDKGCIRPGCSMPPAWCEVHHVTYWENGGNTTVDEGVLTCSYDHHVIHHGGATVTLIEGIPYWTAPPDVDPTQTPHRNTYFNPLPPPPPVIPPPTLPLPATLLP